GRTLDVERLRLACGSRAPPRIWTFLDRRLFGGAFGGGLAEAGENAGDGGARSVSCGLERGRRAAIAQPELRARALERGKPVIPLLVHPRQLRHPLLELSGPRRVLGVGRADQIHAEPRGDI